MLQSNPGPQANSEYASASCFLDDLNGDGVPETLIGCPDWWGSLGTTDGMVEVRDGATGAVIRTHGASDPPGGNMGFAVTRIADLDGDGTDDYCVSEPTGNGSRTRLGVIYAFSGATGTELWRTEGQQSWSEFGGSIASIDDVTGDGIPDLLVGATDWVVNYTELWRGAAYILSGADGAIAHRQIGSRDSDFFGMLVGQLGDVDGDGFRDLGVSWRGAAYDAPGYLSIYSGDNLRLLHVIEGPPRAAFDPTGWGQAFCNLGDLDGDGADETAVGAPWQDHGIYHGVGAVYVYRGRTGQLLWSKFGAEQYGDFGHILKSAGDLDGDGLTDLAVTELERWPGGAVHLLSGRDGRSLALIESDTYRDDFGASLDASADVDGDGLNDLLIGAREDDLFQPGVGRYEIHRWNPMLRSDARTASNSTAGSLSLQVDLPLTEAGQSYSLLLSKTGTGPTPMGGARIPLSQDQLLDRTRRGNPPAGFVNANGTLDASGHATITFQWQPGDFVGEVGLTYWACVVSHDAAGVRTVSVAVPVTITP